MCRCGNDYFESPELFDLHNTDPLVVECLDCGETVRMDCHGVTCLECEMDCEGGRKE